MTTPRNLVEIIGGGLAGLSLGLALRRAGVAVTLSDAGGYPRHRVCGEFITGLGPRTIERLELAPFFTRARRSSEVSWFLRDRLLRRQTLPVPALTLSRHALDLQLAEAFVTAGGHLKTMSRVDLHAAPAGRVFATGRRPSKTSPWLGLKCHALGLPLHDELELHLGDHAYVGLCAIEDGRVNISGLFRRREGLEISRETALPAYLRAAGLGQLAGRLEAAGIDSASYSAVAGLGFGRAPRQAGRLVIGDTFAMTPPFTGNGMAMAFQSAECALDPLLAWSSGAASWPDTLRCIHRRLHARFRRRLAFAALVHPLLYHPAGQRGLAAASGTGLLPVGPLYHALH